jgi:hypothetical protein
MAALSDDDIKTLEQLISRAHANKQLRVCAKKQLRVCDDDNAINVRDTDFIISKHGSYCKIIVDIVAQAPVAVAAPVAATPVVATPVVATPVVATPVVATPVVATPVVATPVVAAQAAAAPVVAAPVVAATQAAAAPVPQYIVPPGFTDPATLALMAAASKASDPNLSASAPAFTPSATDVPSSIAPMRQGRAVAPQSEHKSRQRAVASQGDSQQHQPRQQQPQRAVAPQGERKQLEFHDGAFYHGDTKIDMSKLSTLQALPEGAKKLNIKDQPQSVTVHIALKPFRFVFHQPSNDVIKYYQPPKVQHQSPIDDGFKL